jgi:hypothetical protein
MVEVTVEDVMVRVPKNEKARWLDPQDAKKLGLLRVILLRNGLVHEFCRFGSDHSKVT